MLFSQGKKKEPQMQSTEWKGTMPGPRKFSDGSRYTMWMKKGDAGESVVLRSGRKYTAFFAFDSGSFSEERLFKNLEDAKRYAEQAANE